MVRIEPFLLWLGHVGDCRNLERLDELGIEAVVQLAIEEPVASLPRHMLLMRVPLHDGVGNSAARLRLAVEIVHKLLADQVPTLVCCSAGASRAPAIAACALALLQDKTLADCLQYVHNFRRADLSPGLWQDLVAIYG